MTQHTDHINLTNDELLNLTYIKENPTQLEIELAQRLEVLMQEVDDLTGEELSLEQIFETVDG